MLRDLFKRGKYPDVILPMCVIRRLDAVLEPTKAQVLDTKRLLDREQITEQRAALCDAAGQDFYNTSKFTLRDLKSRGSQQQLLADFLAGAERDKLDPVLDACVAVYLQALDEDGQVDFKGKAKAFCRSYAFLSSVLPYNKADWERLAIFLDLLTPKLPAPKDEDLAKGILESIDMDSYRVEKRAVASLLLADQEAEIEPLPIEGGGKKPEPDLDPLSVILQRFNEQFGTTFSDADRILRHIRDDIAPKVAADPAFRNALENTPHTARLAHDQALAKAAQGSIKDYTQFYKQFVENDDFKRFVGDMVFRLASVKHEQGRPQAPP
ncbi:MAG: type I restriction-modification system subunit M N-terminal domain-containing protein [Rubrivivax sp.]|nr:type I restriction-modification system subunit M N-terminal domain-containing protein [Rubrivivax sp.]